MGLQISTTPLSGSGTGVARFTQKIFIFQEACDKQFYQLTKGHPNMTCPPWKNYLCIIGKGITIINRRQYEYFRRKIFLHHYIKD